MSSRTKTHLARTLIVFVGTCVLGWSSVGFAAQPALAATLCVARATPGCFSTVQAAVDAAHDGDTIKIGPGTFAGGITIDTSVELVGAGGHATIIKGGGPVITIGTLFGATQPTVSIRRVTITGGLTTTKPPGYWVTEGGGVWIPPAEGYTTGATVSISDSVIARNTVAPATVDPPEPSCGIPGTGTPPVGCAFAHGGGIANSGALTVTNTRISDNAVGPSVAHEAAIGGIGSGCVGTLTLRGSFVTGNRVVANAPNGILAAAGGIGTCDGLTMEDSVVSGNSVDIDASFSGQAVALDGGMDLEGSATITRTTVRGNSVEGTNDSGPVLVGGGGIGTDVDVSLVLRDSIVDHNSLSATSTFPGAVATSYSGGIEIQGVAEVTGSRFVANEVSASAPAGFPVAAGGGIFAWTFAPASVSDSLVADNSVSSVTRSGEVVAAGGGVLNAGQLRLRRTVVTANDASGAGPAGVVLGGGLWNGVVSEPGFPENVQLTLIDVRVTGNKLTGSAGMGIEGGGIFTAFPITMSGTVIAGNQPDQCSGR